jgi:hypothetical protein
MQEVCFEAFSKIVRHVDNGSFSPRAITGNFTPESLLAQTRDLLFGETSQSGGRGVPGGRIVGVLMKTRKNARNLTEKRRLLATDCTVCADEDERQLPASHANELEALNPGKCGI